MKIESKNYFTGISHKIPENLDDKTEIDAFLLKNKGKKLIVIQGLGFVGSVMALVCANSKIENYAVIGIDLPNEKSYWKIKSINDGIFPINSSDKLIETFYQNSRKLNNFYATFDPYCFTKADVIIIDINLDVIKNGVNFSNQKSYEVPLNGFKNAVYSIGQNCREDVLILTETTVPPGTSINLIKPIIDSCLLSRGMQNTKYLLGHSYERVMPGPNYIDSIKNFYRVYAGIDSRSADAVELFLKTIISVEKYPLTRLSNTNATELSKVLENSYRAMNIAFITEWSRFAEEADVNLFEVIDAIKLRPTHSNMMYPSLGVGGYCLTKDSLLASWSLENIFKSKYTLNQSLQSLNINDSMPKMAFTFLSNQYFKECNLELKGLKILLLGVSYRSNIGDTRFTPVELLFDLLSNNNNIIHLHDPYVNYWEEKKLFINQDLQKSLNETYDILIFSTGHIEYKSKEFIEILKNKKNMFIFDAVGLLNNYEIELISINNIVKVIGRGDLNK